MEADERPNQLDIVRYSCSKMGSSSSTKKENYPNSNNSAGESGTSESDKNNSGKIGDKKDVAEDSLKAADSSISSKKTSTKDPLFQKNDAKDATKEPSKGTNSSMSSQKNTQGTSSVQSTSKDISESQSPVLKANKVESGRTAGSINVKESVVQSSIAPAATGSINVKDSVVPPSIAPAAAVKDEKNEEKILEAPGVKEDDHVIPDDPEDQMKFDMALDSACLLLNPDHVMKKITRNVTKLSLQRALPIHFDLTKLLNQFGNLKELDLSRNDMGPQAFRAICLAMCSNATIASLNLARNKSDTDTAESIGMMLQRNKTLIFLDVSSNYLGKDFFSRNVGPALKVNNTLRTLRAEGIGSTDVRLLLDGLKENKTLSELDLSNNEVTDKTGFGQGISEWLKKPDCVVTSLALSRCRITEVGLHAIEEGLSQNKSLLQLNLTGNEFGSLSRLLCFVVTAVKHPSLQTLSLDEEVVKSQDVNTEVSPCESISSLKILSLGSSNLCNQFFTTMLKFCKGKLLHLIDLDLTNNESLTPMCIESIISITSDGETPSSLRRLTFSMNESELLFDQLSSGKFPALQYLNLRRSHMTPGAVGHLSQLLIQENSCLTSLILDGLKISNTVALSVLFANAKQSKLNTLSLGGCSLEDNDLSPLNGALKNNLQLQMLKLSANRITDAGIASLVDTLLKHKSHPLAVLDLSNNELTNATALKLSSLFTTKNHETKLHSLNLSANIIRKDGLISIFSALGGKSPLQTLYLSHQRDSLEEAEMVEIFHKLAAMLGFKVQKEGDKIKVGCCDLPNLPERLRVQLNSLGGHTGEIGKMLDSPRILTDYTHDRLPTLSLAHVMEICAVLKGLNTGVCVWSDKEWNMIIGANKAASDVPSWLQLSKSRDVGVYLSNLPGNTTTQKIEAILEMEADCSLEEVCFMKDPVTRSINGTGWLLLSNETSVQKAVDFFNSGEAKVFGQAFMISQIKVKVDNEANSQAAEKARKEVEERLKQRRQEDQAHQLLIQRSTEESWKRHAYRLAHPAYADGRIW
ncbi:hypothetical protein CHS0354_017066 [Potamilus streckersoni]|uniref:Uncharacterized protein n=2 Tax=Potamilus streckersoni TaxID=2493646 RepID=A0AAE0VQ37_9BIVA|nr:hypothetical protein CHS0354_017066 [Potamilus streckersoni]